MIKKKKKKEWWLLASDAADFFNAQKDLFTVKYQYILFHVPRSRAVNMRSHTQKQPHWFNSAIALPELFIILGVICGFLVKPDRTKYMGQR